MSNIVFKCNSKDSNMKMSRHLENPKISLCFFPCKALFQSNSSYNLFINVCLIAHQHKSSAWPFIIIQKIVWVCVYVWVCDSVCVCTVCVCTVCVCTVCVCTVCVHEREGERERGAEGSLGKEKNAPCLWQQTTWQPNQQGRGVSVSVSNNMEDWSPHNNLSTLLPWYLSCSIRRNHGL